jgi:hypothetical protein
MTHQTTKDAKQYRKRQLSRIRYTSILNYNKEDKKKRYCFIPLNTIINTIMIILQRTILKQQLFNPS